MVKFFWPLVKQCIDMSKRIKLEELVAYDFSNLDTQENSEGNCFQSCEDSCVCDCDCDGGCDYCDDEGACDFCDNNCDGTCDTEEDA